ncbi:IclR family transcriptional regulator C-terminal domain-containing protein [Streptomyces sp. CSDS2]|uniref:IclR family transcriptional regulator n=1 Tax=Streptomyces sp. CSDS2 TaxID=3055051 RepID=UPI0025B20BE1|nr:IclR family transcriptional regulator C-terminal domain-containing protein [Streptomyces sp. CSDS2]MDN3261304.1 IclR family transcriptional regulator C-terminal domain-containing protein [Streptomyces sp. CSDS2]
MPHLQSVDRALALLDELADADGPLSAKSLASRLGCSLSTVYELLGSLSARGYVARGPRGYGPGPRIATLHTAFRRHVGADTAVSALLDRVRRATGAQAYFTVYRDGLITTVDTTEPLADPASPWQIGPETRAHATAHGKVLLAGLSRPERRRYLTTHGMARLTTRTITGQDRFEAEVARVRTRGLAVSVAEADPAYTCLAVPVPGHPRHALSVSLSVADYRRRGLRVGSLLTDAVARFPALPE